MGADRVKMSVVLLVKVGLAKIPRTGLFGTEATRRGTILGPRAIWRCVGCVTGIFFASSSTLLARDLSALLGFLFVNLAA